MILAKRINLNIKKNGWLSFEILNLPLAFLGWRWMSLFFSYDPGDILMSRDKKSLYYISSFWTVNHQNNCFWFTGHNNDIIVNNWIQILLGVVLLITVVNYFLSLYLSLWNPNFDILNGWGTNSILINIECVYAQMWMVQWVR